MLLRACVEETVCWRAFGAHPCALPICSHSLSPRPPAANGATALLSGILRGSGRQKVGAVVNGVSNYAVGLPLQLLLAFRLGHGVAGLWWGIAAAATLQAAVLAVLVSRFDWNRETARSARLVRHLSQSSVGSARAQQAAAAAGTPPSGDLAVPLLL